MPFGIKRLWRPWENCRLWCDNNRDRRSRKLGHLWPSSSRAKIPVGNYDVAEKAKYSVPDYWDIGEVFARLVEDLFDDDTVITGIKTIFQSWLTERILNFNSDLYYQPRDYLAECYREGTVIAA